MTINPHEHLIESICNEVLPNTVLAYRSGKFSGSLNYDYYETTIETEVSLAMKALLYIPPEKQAIYREKIQKSFTANLDQLRQKT
ncbi:MAG: hypothetical protein EHJ95_03365 [Methanobacteriota archaeon]|nr:MAG: hypothetical protein EHJ95_03365 [Euryarchaeota archaeon]